MENLGKHLHDLRESKELDYRAIFLDIRIRPEQIKLIEENRFFDLGPYGVAKAIVYNYARYLEADVPEVMAELSVMMPEHTKTSHARPQNVRHSKILLSTNFLWSVGIVIFALVLASFVYYAYMQDWLRTPELFKTETADKNLAAEKETTQEIKPDSLRLKMRQLSETIYSEPVGKQKDGTKKALSDTTDYMGNLLGNSPINVLTQ
ncbi:MAG: helix-turn-helix domain-containing protein [Candidatus Cloacimonadaceae bacterium]|nr:helix-turn-helix domain-containing protein [Candidatus Cloacimonadaceae bacterium]MDP3113870.1 helix-turn-helix domain-containing protein [Candidatus Cloacimonadaceae bacterium]